MKKLLVHLFIFIIGAAAIAGALFFKAKFEYYWVILILGALLCFFAIITLVGKKDGVKLNAKYKRKDFLITKPEYNFLQLLRQVNPSKYEVLPQIALVTVIDKLSNNAYRNELFRIADFCFVDIDTFAPLLLVELNDASHNRPERAMRDAKVQALCKAAGLPLVTFWMNKPNDFSSIRREVLKNILKK